MLNQWLFRPWFSYCKCYVINNVFCFFELVKISFSYVSQRLFSSSLCYYLLSSAHQPQWGSLNCRQLSQLVCTEQSDNCTLYTCKQQTEEDNNKRPMGLDALLENQLGHLPKFQKLHIYSISTSGVEFGLIFTLWAVVSEIRANFQNCHIYRHETWSLAQSSRSCTYTLFLPQEVEIELIFALRAAVSEIWTNFQNCHIWAWNLASSQSSTSCSYTLFLPQGVEIDLIFVLRAAVSEIPANF